MIVGIILAGGLATRMGGGDKALRPLGGRPLLRRVVDRLGVQVDRLAISANGDPARLADLGLPVIADDLPDRPGPLAGILAGMDHAAATADAELILSVAADCPFLPHDLAPRLLATLRAREARICLARSGGAAHPTVALWDVGLRRDLRRAVAEEGLRKVGAFVAGHPNAAADWPTTPYDPFLNVNAPADLAAAETILADHPEA